MDAACGKSVRPPGPAAAVTMIDLTRAGLRRLLEHPHQAAPDDR